ncbi:hypothetical protein HXV84_25205 [Pseudomonas amygdali pv. morsprunorum]|nr:hypothetical protein [Pseudomonas amygdali pv. morsprunorum]
MVNPCVIRSTGAAAVVLLVDSRRPGKNFYTAGKLQAPHCLMKHQPQCSDQQFELKSITGMSVHPTGRVALDAGQFMENAFHHGSALTGRALPNFCLMSLEGGAMLLFHRF